MDARTLLDRDLPSIGEWVQDKVNHRLLRDEPLAELETLLSGPSEPDANVASDIAFAFEFRASWLLNYGAAEVVAEKSTGWNQMASGLGYALKSIELGWQRSDRLGKPTTRSANDIGLSLAASVVFGMDATWVGQRASRALYDRERPFQRDSSIVAPLAIGLWELQHRGTTQAEQIAPVYGRVLSTLVGDALGLDDALADACDLHVARAVGGGDEEDWEYDSIPFSVFPVEILAALRMARARGLSPTVNHDLLSSPLAEPPESPIQLANDPLLDDAIARANREIERL